MPGLHPGLRGHGFPCVCSISYLLRKKKSLNRLYLQTLGKDLNHHSGFMFFCWRTAVPNSFKIFSIIGRATLELNEGISVKSAYGGASTQIINIHICCDGFHSTFQSFSSFKKKKKNVNFPKYSLNPSFLLMWPDFSRLLWAWLGSCWCAFCLVLLQPPLEALPSPWVALHSIWTQGHSYWGMAWLDVGESSGGGAKPGLRPNHSRSTPGLCVQPPTTSSCPQT